MRGTVPHSMDTVEVMRSIDQAHRRGVPFSLIRVGHAEMFVIRYHTWQYDMVDFDAWTEYCGITHLDSSITDRIIDAIRSASVVGTRHHTGKWKGRMRQIFEHYELDPPVTCSAWVTHYMVCRPDFGDLLRHRKIAVVGRRAPEVISKLSKADAVEARVLEGFEDMEPVLNTLNSTDFDIALVAGGVPATILCPDIASTTGRIAIDFGHALDLLIDGVGHIDCQQYYEDLVSRYNREEV